MNESDGKFKWEKWCHFSQQNQNVFERILSVYLTLLKSIILVDLAYLAGVLGLPKLYDFPSGFELSIKIGVVSILLSILFALLACIPGIYALGKQSEHIWTLNKITDGKACGELADYIWKESEKYESWAGNFLKTSLFLTFSAFVCLIIWIS